MDRCQTYGSPKTCLWIVKAASKFWQESPRIITACSYSRILSISTYISEYKFTGIPQRSVSRWIANEEIRGVSSWRAKQVLRKKQLFFPRCYGIDRGNLFNLIYFGVPPRFMLFASMIVSLWKYGTRHELLIFLFLSFYCCQNKISQFMFITKFQMYAFINKITVLIWKGKELLWHWNYGTMILVLGWLYVYRKRVQPGKLRHMSVKLFDCWKCFKW